MNSIGKGLRKLLSDKEVLQLIGSHAKLLTYPELAQYPSIEDAFGDCDKIVLLYVNTMDDSSMSGHWCLLTKHKSRGKTIVEFTDPYGMMPDDQLKSYSKRWKQESGQDHNTLTRLLYEFSLSPKHEVHYNELDMQRENDDVNTCGRWTAIRGYFYKIPLKTFQNRFKALKRNGFDLDKVAVALTDMMSNHTI